MLLWGNYITRKGKKWMENRWITSTGHIISCFITFLDFSLSSYYLSIIEWYILKALDQSLACVVIDIGNRQSLQTKSLGPQTSTDLRSLFVLLVLLFISDPKHLSFCQLRSNYSPPVFALLSSLLAPVVQIHQTSPVINNSFELVQCP